MEIISTREFRANQTRVLDKVLKGESVILRSRKGNFKITPVTREDSLTEGICQSLREVKMIRDGVLPKKSIQDFLNEL